MDEFDENFQFEYKGTIYRSKEEMTRSLPKKDLMIIGLACDEVINKSEKKYKLAKVAGVISLIATVGGVLFSAMTGNFDGIVKDVANILFPCLSVGGILGLGMSFSKGIKEVDKLTDLYEMSDGIEQELYERALEEEKDELAKDIFSELK